MTVLDQLHILGYYCSRLYLYILFEPFLLSVYLLKHDCQTIYILLFSYSILNGNISNSNTLKHRCCDLICIYFFFGSLIKWRFSLFLNIIGMVIIKQIHDIIIKGALQSLVNSGIRCLFFSFVTQVCTFFSSSLLIYFMFVRSSFSNLIG